MKRKDGDEFEASSLRGFISSFNHHMKTYKHPKNIIEDLEFEQTRKAQLEARSKLLKKERKRNKPNAAEAVTDEEVSILYMKNPLGIMSAQASLNTMWFMNSIHFELRGYNKHRQNNLGRCSTHQRCGRN